MNVGEYAVKIGKIFDRMMVWIYVSAMVMEAAFVFVIWAPGLGLGDYQAHSFYYSIVNGAMFAVNILLICANIKKWPLPTRRMLLEIFLVALAIAGILDLTYYTQYGGFWVDGYLRVILKAVFAATYFSRYKVLHADNALMGVATESEGGAN